MGQLFLFNDFVSDQQKVNEMNLSERVERAIDLLRKNEPEDGYYLAFSGGKDSCVCKKLLQLSGVKFEGWYNQTTIDPPELIYFIKKYHSDVQWSKSKFGNMFHRIATAPKPPPTRLFRWCCQEFKEYAGAGRVKVFGVRLAESNARKKRWSEISNDAYNNIAICPIALWTDYQVWEFIRFYDLEYCSLYDEGFKRIGCVGCPLASKNNQNREFERWPKFEELWKRAIIANWEKWHDIPNTKTGKPRYHARFANGEEFWQAWRNLRYPDYISGNCQMMQLWTNEAGFSDDENETRGEQSFM